MDTLEAMDRLAELARMETPREVEVRDSVLGRIEYERRVRRLRRKLGVVSALAASVVLAVGIWYWSQPADPLATLYELPEVSSLW